MGEVLRKMIFNPSTTAPIATNDVLLPNGPGFGHCHQCCRYNWNVFIVKLQRERFRNLEMQKREVGVELGHWVWFHDQTPDQKGKRAQLGWAFNHLRVSNMQVLYVSRYMSSHTNAVIEKMHQFHRAVLAMPFNTTSYTWYCTHCNVAIYFRPGVFLNFDGCILKMILFQTERYGDDQTWENNGKQPFT